VKFGMNLLLWTTDSADEKFLPLFERLQKMGFDGVQVPVFDLQPKKFEVLGQRLRDLGLIPTAVTVRGAQDNPISDDAAVRATALVKSKLAVECTQALGSTQLVGPLYAALGVFTGKAPTADELQQSVEHVRQLAVHAETCDVTLGLEFLNRFEIYLLNCCADTMRFVRQVNHPRCQMMYDTFHAHIEEKNVHQALRESASKLCHVHISESDRSTPGSGGLNWRDTWAGLKSINYDGWLTIEAFGQSLPELVAATKIWRKMFVDEETVAREGLAFMKQSWSQE
jgi:D-psicose/D-tagatose/L-ribulose 3-epimerase